MEVAVPFENMPDLLRLRIIGTTINYILNVDSQGYGFITQERIEAHFKEYTGVDLNYACQLVNTTFKDFIDEYFSSQFRNCHPHGVVRGSFVDRPVENNFDNFGAPAATSAVAPPPTIRASSNQSTEESSAAPVKADESKSPSAEAYMLNRNLLEIESEDEEAAENKPPVIVKEPASKPTPPPVVKEVPKPLKSGATFLQREMLFSDDSSDEETKTEPPKPVVKESMKQPSKSPVQAKKESKEAKTSFIDQMNNDTSPAAVNNVPVMDDEILDLLDASNDEKSVPIVDDHFLDLLDAHEKPAVQESIAPMVGDDFLDMVDAPANAVPVASDEFLDLLDASNDEKSVPIVDDHFLDLLDARGKPAVQESIAPMVGDDFLDMVDAPANAVPVASDEFLDLLDASNDEKSVPIVDDHFLDLLDARGKPAVQESIAPMVGDDFLDMVDAPANAVPVAGDEFLDLLDASNDEKSVPIVDDHFLDLLDARGKPAVQESIAPMVGDDFLDMVDAPANAVPVAGDEFLDLLDASNDEKSVPIVDDHFLNLLDAQPCKPVVNHKPTNLPSFKAENVAKLIEAAEIGPNYDSDNSETSAPGTSNDTFTPIKYVYDTSYRVPNYDTVHAMKEKIAKSMLPPKLSHLLNFWLENFSGFPELIVFFQYLYYHIERLDRVENLTFKDFHNLIDAIIRREEVFKMISHLVANVPLMCQYKFLIYDNNYPEYIYVNPDLLELQVYPLAPGLPTAVMYLLGSKKKWLLSDLKKEFIDATDKEFYHQLINFCNDRPDLVMLERLRPTSILPEMIIALNDHISLRLCCLMFTLKDLNVAEKLHLRDDYINSMKQFIPQRSS